MTSEQVDKLITFGQMALEQGWYDQAREYFEQALALDASNREAMKGLARIYEILSHKEATAVEPIEDKLVELPHKPVQKASIPEEEAKVQAISPTQQSSEGLREGAKRLEVLCAFCRSPMDIDADVCPHCGKRGGFSHSYERRWGILGFIVGIPISFLFFKWMISAVGGDVCSPVYLFFFLLVPFLVMWVGARIGGGLAWKDRKRAKASKGQG
jgi:tetratricopeptide (TPR) repeat protein